MGIARSALFYLCDRFESVSENSPCAKRREVAEAPRSEHRELWGFHGCGRWFNRVEKPTRVTSDQKDLENIEFSGSFFCTVTLNFPIKLAWKKTGGTVGVFAVPRQFIVSVLPCGYGSANG